MEHLKTGINLISELKEESQIINADGKLVYQTLSQAKEQFNAIYKADKAFLILNLLNLTQIDSTGFGFILNIMKRLSNPSHMAIVIEDEFIKELFIITKINKMVNLYPSVSEAYASIVKC